MSHAHPEWVPPRTKKRRHRRRRQDTITVTPDLIGDGGDAGCCVSHAWLSKHVRTYACVYMALFFVFMLFVFAYAYRVSARAETLRQLVAEGVRRGPVVGALTYSFTESAPLDRAGAVVHDKPLPNGAEGHYAFCCDARADSAGWRAEGLCTNGDGIQSYIADHRIHVSLDVPAEVPDGAALEVACTFAWGGSPW